MIPIIYPVLIMGAVHNGPDDLDVTLQGTNGRVLTMSFPHAKMFEWPIGGTKIITITDAPEEKIEL
jgi:hypothetical protein